MTQRRILIVCCISILMLLVSGPAAMAGPASAESWGEVYNVTWSIPLGTPTYELTTGVVPGQGTPTGTSGSYSEETGTASWALASLNGVSAPRPGIPSVYAHTTATPTGAMSSSADATSSQTWDFAFSNPGAPTKSVNLTFTPLADYLVTANAPLPGEVANATVDLSIILTKKSTNTSGVQSSVTQVDSDSGSSVPLSVTLGFKNGDIGTFTIKAVSHADATSVVPLPAAVLLGFLGLGTTGLGLRKLS